MRSNNNRWRASAAARLTRGASTQVLGWALLFAATGAAAQTQTPASSSSSLDEIVVTGIRHSQISALKVKRANEDIVEAISAEDIGKLPDASIADSIARLPG